jgi:hypothetical protein
MGEHIEQWLASLPVGEPVALDGETVYLHPRHDGAELGCYLLRNFNQAQLEDAARAGFQSARDYAAGLAVDESAHALVLNRWLPGARDWTDVAAPLEELLNQVGLWRALLAPTRVRRDDSATQEEQRVRARFAGGLR